jgi:RES domain-containing protein
LLTVWRIVKTRYVASAFDGQGAKRSGGRWTSVGRRAVYTSSTAALATLEVIAHLDSTALLTSYSLIQAALPEQLVTSVKLSSLPRNWRDFPAPPELQAIGDGWLRERKSAALCVPSALVPVDFNYLLNPEHPDFPLITPGHPVPFPLDPRLFLT